MAPVRALEDALAALVRGGVELAFGLPGTQSVDLFEALRRSRVRTVLTTHELAAAFCANGAYRASGRPAAVLAIPGPGIAYALAALAEARLDSAAVVVLVAAGPTPSPVATRDLAAPVAKAVVSVAESDAAAGCARALEIATSGEPGPVVVEIGGAPQPLPDPPRAPRSDAAAAFARIRAAERPVLFVGQGASTATEDLHHLAERLGAPALVSTSGRGALAEDHALCVPVDLAGERANDLLSACDVVLALGCKLSPNATAGGRICIPRERLVHVDASPRVLAASGASISLEADVPAFVEELVAALDGAPSRAAWHSPISLDPAAGPMEPTFHGVDGGTARAFFEALRRAAPRDAILVTDSGLHQMLARRWYRVLEPRGLLVPTDFQSMGFGLPAAIGAKLA
ncbi:MAG TPA: thiamine pyrophosphate-binding protein, partial [Planctomycetota bacterium]|nr:thiamine pyrophosphate-binding protein [Planctomycetota bacterium]